MKRGLLLTAPLIVAAMFAAACSSDGDSASSDEVPTEVLSETTPDYAADAAAWDGAETDWGVPDAVPDVPTGSQGYSRYVYSFNDDGVVVPILVEGPRGQQTRCQEPDLPCSFQDLVDLDESGDEIPDELGLTPEELSDLVDQLTTTSETVLRIDTLDKACAAGYERVSQQNSNMGIHMSNVSLLSDGFDPANPEMLLFAKDGGETLPSSEIGNCEDGAWVGQDGFEVVGSAFLQLLTDDHPEGYAGDFDLWHVHWNSCGGGEADGVASEKACAEGGGNFFEIGPVWMMHSYVHPDYDNELGVFAMWNNTISPAYDPQELLDSKAEELEAAAVADGQSYFSVNNFIIGEINATVGEELVIANSDDVPHTITSGSVGAPTGEFDTGVFTAAEAYRVTFDEAGEFTVFCALHPNMTGTVVVEE